MSLTTEFVGFVSGRDSCARWRGDVALGLYAEGGVAQLGTMPIWSTSFGLSLREARSYAKPILQKQKGDAAKMVLRQL